MEQQIVVGYDQTDRARVALAWAVDDARLRDADLVVCHAWDVPYASVDRDVAYATRSFAKSTLDEGILLARQGLPDHRVRPLLAQGRRGSS
jgi:nucleotide-binding universal stress UspA family protein